MQNQTLAIDKAAYVVGSKAKLAEALSVTRQAIHNWRLTKVPAERCLDIELLTHGEVSCEQLRPDINWGVIRANASQAPAKDS